MVKWLQQASTEDQVNITELPRHGNTGNLKVHFSRQGKHGEFAKKYLGNLPPTWKMLRAKKIMNL